jgi:hypothetical protein
MTRLPIVLALSLTLLPPCVVAEVYRCQKDGSTVFSDKPCEADAQAYQPKQSIVVVPRDKTPDLAKQYDERTVKETQERDTANDAWNKDYEVRKKKEASFRDAGIKRQAVEGMSQQQVRDLLGNPQITSRNENLGVVREGWTYRNRDGSRSVVYFKNGVVSGTAHKGRK